jgi:hypothetical protein
VCGVCACVWPLATAWGFGVGWGLGSMLGFGWGSPCPPPPPPPLPVFLLYAGVLHQRNRLFVSGPKIFPLGSQNRRLVRSSRHVLMKRKHSNDARSLVVCVAY